MINYRDIAFKPYAVTLQNHYATSQITNMSCDTKPLEDQNKASGFNFKSFFFPISFSGYYFEFKKEENLPCPCCGRIMTTNREINQFVDDMQNAKGKELIENLEKFKDRLPETENCVVNRLISEAEHNEDLKLNELMNKILTEPKKVLENRQREVLADIAIYAERLSDGAYDAIVKDIKAIDTIISEGRDGNPFKRKTLIKGLEKLYDKEDDPYNIQILSIILDLAEGLPTSSNDSNAFIVKYSRRSISETARRLVEPSLSTAEHIKPHSKNGVDYAENFLAECKKCNNDRGNMSYVDWLRIHPEMIVNTQIYMDEIVNRIIDGKITGYDSYPQAAKRALLLESANLINLDTTRIEKFRREKYLKSLQKQSS